MQLALTCMTTEEVSNLYVSRAQQMQEDGKYKEAERFEPPTRGWDSASDASVHHASVVFVDSSRW